MSLRKLRDGFGGAMVGLLGVAAFLLVSAPALAADEDAIEVDGPAIQAEQPESQPPQSSPTKSDEPTESAKPEEPARSDSSPKSEASEEKTEQEPAADSRDAAKEPEKPSDVQEDREEAKKNIPNLLGEALAAGMMQLLRDEISAGFKRRGSRGRNSQCARALSAVDPPGNGTLPVTA